MDEQLVNKLNQIWEAAKVNSPLNQKSAVCVSTIDYAGFPHSRFVDLKEIGPSGLTFCTSYNSEKGHHLANNPKISLCAWWDHIGCQVRVVGNAVRIPNELADKFWFSRSKEAQVTTTCFKQSKVWDSEVSIENHFSSAIAVSEESILRPHSWGGYLVSPHLIEILKFKANRVHTREQYRLNDTSWEMRLLQP
jgi:pyridoxamine 5'-phosphate oxidase